MHNRVIFSAGEIGAGSLDRVESISSTRLALSPKHLVLPWP